MAAPCYYSKDVNITLKDSDTNASRHMRDLQELLPLEFQEIFAKISNWYDQVTVNETFDTRVASHSSMADRL